MAAKKSGLGRGFDSLFLDNSSDAPDDSGSVMLPIGDIEPNRGQARTIFSQESLTELEDSVRQYGVLQPLLVRPMSDGSYRIVAGERRWRAARHVGLTEVPVIIKAFTDAEAAAVSLIENLQREDLNPIEEASGIKKLIDDYGITQEQAAEKLSKSRSAVANSLRLLSLPSEIRTMVTENILSAGHARALLGLENSEAQIEAALEVLDKKLSVRQTEKLVKALNRPHREPKPKEKRDKFYEEVELALSETLARRVSISLGARGGTLHIEFFDDEDLKKLAMAFDES